jgi:SH3 domain protein
MSKDNWAAEQQIFFKAHCFCRAGQAARGIFFPLLVSVLLLPVWAGAESLFVSANIDVPVRRGAGDQYKIVKMVKVNDKTDLLEEKSGWAKVRFQDGDEGWLPKMLLTSVMPVAHDLKNLRQENEQLKQKNTELGMELNAIKEHQDNDGDQLAACIAEQDKIRAERRASEDTGKLFWFLAGGGVLLLGWLLGRFSHGSPRKKSGLSLR